jgi:quaternary ammonium compound-resistance protein SugE
MSFVSSISSAWLIVIVSGLFEIVFSIALKLSDGFSKPIAATISILAGMISIWLMSMTLKVLPVGTVYAVWAGIGTIGTVIIAIIWFAESASIARILSIAAILGGIVALQLQGAAH